MHGHSTEEVRCQQDFITEIVQRYPPDVIAALAREIPDLFSADAFHRNGRASERETALHIESSPELLDDHIRTIAAYFHETEDSLNQLPALAREALRQLVIIRKYLPAEEIARIEERILAGLRKKFGPFNESALVMFLVKFLL